MKNKIWFIVLGIVPILLGILLLAVVLSGSVAARGVRSGDIVQVDYTTTLEDGTVYATSLGHEPLWLILGEAKLLPAIEEAIGGMRISESKTVVLPAENAYGPYHPELVEVVSKSMVPEGVTPQVGKRLQAKGKDGQPFWVVIKEVSGDNVTVDANHPLAGKALTVKIELLAAGENLASSDRANQMIFTWVLAALVMVLAFGLAFFTLRNRRRRIQRNQRKAQPVGLGLARRGGIRGPNIDRLKVP